MATLAEVREYQSFASVAELNLAIRAFMYRHKSKLTASTIAVLRHLARHSAKVPGVSFAKVEYIAKMVGVSERTVKRAMKTLEIEYGAIKRIGRKQSSNIIVIQPQDISVLPAVSPIAVTVECHPPQMDEANNGAASSDEIESEALDFKPCSLREKKSRSNVDADATCSNVDDWQFVPKYVPATFTQIVKSIFPTAQRILDLWQRVTLAARITKREISLTTALQAFNEAYFRFRRGEVRGDLDAYFFGVLKRMANSDEVKNTQTPPPAAGNACQMVAERPLYDYDPKHGDLYTRRGTEFIEDNRDWSAHGYQDERDRMFYAMYEKDAGAKQAAAGEDYDAAFWAQFGAAKSMA